MSNFHLRCSCLLLLVFTSFVIGQETDTTAPQTTEVSFQADLPINHNSLERLLRIRTLTGKFRLKDEYNNFRLRLDFYRGGKRIDVGKTDAGVGGAEPRRFGQFNVQIIDLDYLKLGDAPADHWRIAAQVLTSTEPEGRGVTAHTRNIDVPKEIFDAIPRTGGTGRFEEFPNEGNEIPLFWSASGRVNREPTLEALLKSNPESDILVGVLTAVRTREGRSPR
jgi:hypothetical protein